VKDKAGMTTGPRRLRSGLSFNVALTPKDLEQKREDKEDEDV